MSWRAGGATAIGASHIRNKRPNQDAFYASPTQQSDPRFMICVADGHGSDAYYRSDIGARLAVEAFIEAISWNLDSPEQINSLPQDIVQIWRRLVKQDIGRNPLPPGFERAPGRASDRDIFEPYGSTLVGVAASEQICIVVQIGDGDLLLGYEDGTINRPLAADTGLHGEQTYSLCLDDAPQRVKYKAIKRTETWPDFVLTSTDGVSKAFVDDAAFVDVVRHYRELVRSGEDLQATINALPDWLRQVSDNGSGDDATLCLASRRYKIQDQ